ncbi:5-methylcytosine restriction system specificity protein McrC [Edwardsiella piscicida]|uniref:5-methylcytosine restriction system specificity protein McrC n=1 Tax=Edwardsiella piscicida TaxID=1263550 RepID=UPI0035D9211A
MARPTPPSPRPARRFTAPQPHIAAPQNAPLRPGAAPPQEPLASRVGPGAVDGATLPLTGPRHWPPGAALSAPPRRGHRAPWVKIGGFSPQTMKGDNRAFSLLFPMEKVFEHYVAKTLREQYAPQVAVHAQVQSKSLVTHADAQWFRLKPDMVMIQGKQVIAVLDTKWKLLDPTLANGADKYALQQSDFYQMFAYGHHYFDQQITVREMFLVYPAHANFTAPIAQHFAFPTPGKPPLRLWVVPFVIDKVNPRLALPEASQLYQACAAAGAVSLSVSG